MKLLFDQNISFRAIKHLKTLFPEGLQVRELGLENATDIQIWNYAKTEHYAIVTFDGDFYDLVTLYGHPPKLIWLRIGNTSTQDLVRNINTHFDLIKAFLTDSAYKEVACLEID